MSEGLKLADQLPSGFVVTVVLMDPSVTSTTEPGCAVPVKVTPAPYSAALMV